MHKIDENEVLRDALSGLTEEVPPMPGELHAAWMQRLESDAAKPVSAETAREKRTERNLNRRALTRFLSYAAAMVFVVGGALTISDDVDRAVENRRSYEAMIQQNDAMAVNALTAAEYKAELDSLETAYTFTTAAEAGPRTKSIAAGGARAAVEEPVEDAVVAEAAAMDIPAPEAPANHAAAEERKVIRTARLTLYTQTFDQCAENLRALCLAEGGWVEASSESVNSRTSLRTGHLTLRIPQEAMNGYITGAGELGRITSRSETAQDVTASYQDTQTRLNTQLALMERLQSLITESADLSDVLALESQLANTQYQIDALTTSLNNTDRQVSYATVTISLYEEAAPAITDQSVSLGERISAALGLGWTAFTDFLQDILVFLIAALPFLGIVAALAIVAFVIRKIRRRNKK